MSAKFYVKSCIENIFNENKVDLLGISTTVFNILYPQANPKKYSGSSCH